MNKRGSDGGGSSKFDGVSDMAEIANLEREVIDCMTALWHISISCYKVP